MQKNIGISYLQASGILLQYKTNPEAECSDLLWIDVHIDKDSYLRFATGVFSVVSLVIGKSSLYVAGEPLLQNPLLYLSCFFD